MKKTSLKIGLVSKGFKKGTGPGSYSVMLKDALSGKHDICQISGSCPGMFDVIHIVDAKRIAPEIIKSFNAPVIADFHDDYWTSFQRYPCPDYPLRWLRQKQLKSHHLEVIKKADAVVVHSQSVKSSIEKLIDEADLDNETPGLFVVPYSVKLPDDKIVSDKMEKDLILFVGRDIFRKGFPVIIKALPKVIEKKPNARLVVIGDEYTHTKLYAKFMARGLPVEFLPGLPREEIGKWYEKSSVLALPSYAESFGIVLIEAMAEGLPVVASNVGGVPEAIEDGISGLLHEKSAADDLAEKIIKVLSNESLKKILISGGRQKAQKFSINNLENELEKVYRKLTDE
jgi:glycosyltransferase involved in cell wall biosynthesis